MTTRADLHALIDELPEVRLDSVRAALESELSPIERALALAPDDDEPESLQEKAAVREARESLAAGESGMPLADLRRQLGV